MECYEEAVHYQGKRGRVAVICDGGIDVGGSLSKAYAAGAHLAIMGRAFAATHESPGKMFASPNGESQIHGLDMMHKMLKKGYPVYKEYRGSASMEAQMVYKKRGEIITSEGVKSLVQVYGSVGDVLGRFNGALRSSMSYLGAKTLADFRSNAIFRLVANGVFNQQKARSLQTCEVTV
jgi:IMP dehydrogenase/GMP reductase